MTKISYQLKDGGQMMWTSDKFPKAFTLMLMHKVQFSSLPF